MDTSTRLTGFKEKAWGKGDRYASIGMYCMKKEIAKYMPDREVFSLEYDLFPALVRSLPCFGYRTEGIAHDIGTNERYAAGLHILLSEEKEV